MEKIRKNQTPNPKPQTQPPMVVIVGETASGKSALALEIAKKFDGEIISADSWQVYRGFDIGTAKPTAAEQADIPHHLIDIVDAKAHFSAAVYKRLANQAITDIAKRGKLPILTGGTGLYIDGVLFDFSFLPKGDSQTRKELNKLTSTKLLARLNQQGIDTTGIDTRNKRRLIRLLETNGARPSKQSLRPNTLIIGLKINRGQLRENIEKRVEAMFSRGLKREVEALAKQYGWKNEGMKGIGYREWQPYFEGKSSVGAVKRKIIKSTLDLAKRQRTWFKRNRHIKWVDNQAKAARLASRFIKS